MTALKVTKNDVIWSVITAVVALFVLWVGTEEPQKLIYLFVGGFIYRSIYDVIPPEMGEKK